METILKRIGNRLVRRSEERLRRRVLRHVSDAPPPPFGDDSFRATPIEEPERAFLVRTEASPDIAFLPRLRVLARWGWFSDRWPARFDGGAGRVAFRQGGFDVDVPSGRPSQWVFLQQKEPLPEPCALSFDVSLDSEFTEFQIAFRIRHILRRCRFLLVDNRSLQFEIVDRGAFVRAVRAVPLRLECGRTYHVDVMFSNGVYAFRLDGRTLLSVRVDLPWIGTEPLPFGIILFEKSEARPIRASISNLTTFVAAVKSIRQSKSFNLSPRIP